MAIIKSYYKNIRFILIEPLRELVKIYKIDVTNIHLKLAEVLLKCIKQDGKKAIITYSEMCERADNIVDPRSSGGFLGDLSSICHQNDLPLISAMVVSKDSFTPGTGFFKLYKELTGETVHASDEEDIFEKELAKVRNLADWYILADILGLDVFPEKSKKEAEITAKEGKLKLEQHLTRERDPKIVKKAKLLFFKTHGKLYCECCKFDFKEFYGDLCNKHFIEAHHSTKAIAEMEEDDVTNITDLKMVCSNCHKILHMKNNLDSSFEDVCNYVKNKKFLR